MSVERLNKVLGVNLIDESNVNILLTKYTEKEYIDKVLDVRLKPLQTQEERCYHFITGICSELNEMSTPYLQLLDLTNFGNILEKDLQIFDQNILWNLLEEFGDYEFFKVGLVQELNLNIDRLPIGKIQYNLLFETIKGVLTNADVKTCSEYVNNYGEIVGLYYLTNHLIEQLTSLVKKNVITEKSTTFVMLKPKIEAIIYALDLIIDYMIKNTNDAVYRVYSFMNVDADLREVLYPNNKPISLVDLGSIFYINDLKLSKRYVGKLTDKESDNRDYNKEKSMN